MKKIISIITALTLCLAVFTACGNSDDKTNSLEQQGALGVSGTVSTAGSTSTEKVIGALIEAFTIENPNVAITYDPTGSSAGITSTKENTCDIGLSSRALKDTETGLDAKTFAIDGIAIVVNKENPVTDLTVEQIMKLATGEIKNWSEVGGEDREVVLIGREPGSGTRDGFETIVDVKEKCKYMQELNSTGAVIAAVSANPNAFGYASESAVGDTVKPVSVGGVMPNKDTILDGSYVIQRPFILMTNQEKTQSAAAQAFIDFCMSEKASDIILNSGVVPPAK
ncbi:MAG: phosphate ABC transporter substrate-binding protein [Oscillospiraceae bacterium]